MPHLERGREESRGDNEGKMGTFVAGNVTGHWVT